MTDKPKPMTPMIDWEQPQGDRQGWGYCFHVEDDGGFCGRAKWWEGHLQKDKIHDHVPFEAYIQALSLAAYKRGMKRAAEILNGESRSVAEMAGRFVRCCQASLFAGRDKILDAAERGEGAP